MTLRFGQTGLAALAALSLACSSTTIDEKRGGATEDGRESQALVLALAVLGQDDNGRPRPLPARIHILERDGDEWKSRFIEDPDSTAFHKAMAFRFPDGTGGLLTLGGAGAAVKLWPAQGNVETLWEADFGGEFSRMRDGEIGDIYGDGVDSIAVATHDRGVVAVLRPQSGGKVAVEELDRQAGVFVHEIELGDLDADGVLEIYATPSAPNRMDGRAQVGEVVRYVPALGKGRETLVDMGDRHAKEILATDLDGDGRDELYISVEAVSGGQVEIRRYTEQGGEPSVETVARLDDKLCRFLTAGDVDGDGRRELVAAANRSGLWLLEPRAEGEWETTLIDADSSGFEHASILLDLDGDGRDELYVASDRQAEVRRYDWSRQGWSKQVLHKYEGGMTGFTWNIMPVPLSLLPAE